MDTQKLLLCLLAALAYLPALPYSGKTVYSRAFAPNEGLVNRLEKPYRHEICLNGYWDFQKIDLPKDYKYGAGRPPELSKPVDGKWDQTHIKIPSP